MPPAGRSAYPALLTDFNIPSVRDIDARLLTGAAGFGIGCGIGRFCAGQARSAPILAARGALSFVPVPLIGVFLGRRLNSKPFAPRSA